LISFTAVPATPSPNLDIELAIYDGAGSLVTHANPVGLAGTLSASLPEGTYYLALDGVGTGDPITAYNDYGSLGEYSLTGTLVANGNQPPVVVASANVTTGTAPLAVNFSSAGTLDSDGSITTYDWQFGDGNGSTAANPTHTYSNPGTYEATLVAWDNGGLSGSAKVTITVSVAPVAAKVYVANIAMSATTSRNGNRNATADVTVRDASGRLISGATVAGTWSGIVSSTASVSTNRRGVASFRSPTTRSPGTFSFSVTRITAAGFVYDATLNLESSDSITLP
jgi:PKD repeat protein